MINVILRDGSRWQPDSYIGLIKGRVNLGFVETGPAILRLYSDKAIAGYLLPGVPAVLSLNLYTPWREPLQQDDFSR